MLHSFAKIAFTQNVRLMQDRYESRSLFGSFDIRGNAPVIFTQRETEFIETRDSFYLATVSETGWPYVQHRGGPEGFLKVLDNKTLCFADYRGNRQYVSTGNISGNNRIALIMVDYVERRRLKIFGLANLLHDADKPEILDYLRVPGYPASVERAFIIQVEAFSWNCSKHITPRNK